MTTTYIYTLSDPRDNSVRYVGRTVEPKTRLSSHISQKDNSVKSNWVIRLRADGVKPVMTIIDSSDDKVIAREKEQFWINKYTADGCELLNQTGAFISNFSFSVPLPLFYKMRDLLNARQMTISELICHLIDSAELS